MGADKDGTYHEQWKSKPVWRVGNAGVSCSLYVVLKDGRYFVGRMPFETGFTEGSARHATFDAALLEAKELIRHACTVGRLTGQPQNPSVEAWRKLLEKTRGLVAP